MEKQSVLLVDDHPENLVVLEQSLDGLGLDLIKATSGNDALAIVLERDLALVLLDVQMPGMDGYEMAELMRQFDKSKYIPIIFVTASMGPISKYLSPASLERWSFPQPARMY